jgi:NAD(P)-dependent dehydrogenase (short-subunit alcohol dehydrogenase family)
MELQSESQEVVMTQNLVGKIALVTGAARGIGRASAVALAPGRRRRDRS